MGHGGLKLPFLGQKRHFWPSEIADFEAILAFSIQFFTYIPLYWPYMMMRYVGAPPMYLYKGPGSLKCPYWPFSSTQGVLKLAKLVKFMGFFVCDFVVQKRLKIDTNV